MNTTEKKNQETKKELTSIQKAAYIGAGLGAGIGGLAGFAISGSLSEDAIVRVAGTLTGAGIGGMIGYNTGVKTATIMAVGQLAEGVGNLGDSLASMTAMSAMAGMAKNPSAAK